MGLAGTHDMVVTLCVRPGDFVMAGELVALAWPGERVDDERAATLAEALILGQERSAQQDVRFVVNQLVEVASRALSPGINDPFTAITCLDHLGAALRRVAQRPLPDGRRYDDGGRLRVIAEPVRFDELVDAAFDQIRRYGAAHLAVVTTLLGALTRIGAATADEERRAPLRRQAELAYQGSIEAMRTDGDRQTLTERYRSALAALGSDSQNDGRSRQGPVASSPWSF